MEIKKVDQNPIREEKGVTLIEVLIACVVILLAAYSVSYSLAMGLAKIKFMKIERMASECAKIAVEYFNTMPPDIIYGSSPQTIKEGDFKSTDIFKLNEFVNATDSTCRQLSDTSTTLGSTVRLKYAICPGCLSCTYTEAGADTPITVCEYTLRLRVTYRTSYPKNAGLATSNDPATYRKIEYYLKLYSNRRYDCVDTFGSYPTPVCGAGGDCSAGGDTVRDCGNW